MPSARWIRSIRNLEDGDLQVMSKPRAESCVIRTRPVAIPVEESLHPTVHGPGTVGE
jgi:hypothetical protein